MSPGQRAKIGSKCSYTPEISLEFCVYSCEIMKSYVFCQFPCNCMIRDDPLRHCQFQTRDVKFAITNFPSSRLVQKAAWVILRDCLVGQQSVWVTYPDQNGVHPKLLSDQNIICKIVWAFFMGDELVLQPMNQWIHVWWKSSSSFYGKSLADLTQKVGRTVSRCKHQQTGDLQNTFQLDSWILGYPN